MQDDGRAIAACAGRVILIGDSAPLDSGNSDFIVRALDAASGALLWSDRVQSDAHDNARSLVCDNERVLVTLTSGFNDPVAILRAYDIDDGPLLWSVQYEDRFGNNPTDLVLHDATAFVSITTWDDATSSDPTSARTVVITRALDAKFGEILWENEYPVASLLRAATWQRMINGYAASTFSAPACAASTETTAHCSGPPKPAAETATPWNYRQTGRSSSSRRTALKAGSNQ